MSTMMGNTRLGLCLATACAVMAVFATSVARADVASDKPGAVLIFPKIVVDTNGIFGPPTDTEIQLTNTSSHAMVGVRCFLVDATSHCNNNSQRPCTAENEATHQADIPTCNSNGGVCLADTCKASDFEMILTKRQPITWKASEGLSNLPCDGRSPDGFCANGASNGTSSFVRPVPEDPFFGEMKCVQVDPQTLRPTGGSNPANGYAGDLKAEVTIVSKDTGGRVDARKYNAIAFQEKCSTANPPPSCKQDGTPETLTLGGPAGGAEYNGGPNILIMDHFFDGAEVVTHKGNAPSSILKTDLTVVPVNEDLTIGDVSQLNPITLQFLVFNEFEQRFSTSTSLACWRELQLSDIDTRVGPFGNSSSIFNANVEGTLTGQTRIRSVAGATTANTVVGIAEEFWSADRGPGNSCTDSEGYSTGCFTAATNLHFTGTRSDKADQIILHPNE